MADRPDTSAACAIERPDSCPAPGVVPAFDAGWNAHEIGLGRDTVRDLTPPSGKEWALLGYDIRRKIKEGHRAAA